MQLRGVSPARPLPERRFGWEAILALALAGFAACEHLFGLPKDIWWLWLIPLGLAARAVTGKWIVAFAAAGAVLANVSYLLEGSNQSILRVPLMLLVFSSTLAFRRAIAEREEAIEDLRSMTLSLRASQNEGARYRNLIESIPVGALTVAASGKILTANAAAHEVMGIESGKLCGRSVTAYFPLLANLLLDLRSNPGRVRSAMECRASRRDGRVFEAQVCFCTFGGPSGPELGVLFQDSQVWAPEGLDVASNLGRLAASVDLHEIRNMSLAIEATCHDVLSGPDDRRRPVLRTLEHLARALGRLCSRELRPQAEGGSNRVVFDDFAAELRHVLERAFFGSGIRLAWMVPTGLSPIWADAEGLLQVFLNLANNSRNALARSGEPKQVWVSAAENEGRVLIRFSDSGAGPAWPDELFRPVVNGPDVIRVGLYIARSVVRTFGGDLRYQRHEGRPSFVVELLTEDHAERIGSVEKVTG